MEKIFKDNPRLDVVYKTTDGKCFYTQDAALEYSKTLADRGVSKVLRTTVNSTPQPNKVKRKVNTTKRHTK